MNIDRKENDMEDILSITIKENEKKRALLDKAYLLLKEFQFGNNLEMVSKRMYLSEEELLNLLSNDNLDKNTLDTIKFILDMYKINRYSNNLLSSCLWANKITRSELMNFLNYKGTKNSFATLIDRDKKFYYKVCDASISVYVNKITNNKGLKYEESYIETLNLAINDYNKLDDNYKDMICNLLNITKEELEYKLKERPLDIYFFKMFTFTVPCVFYYAYNAVDNFRVTVKYMMNEDEFNKQFTKDCISRLSDDKELFKQAVKIAVACYSKELKKEKGKSLRLVKNYE